MYPSVGWLAFRNKACVPPSLVYHVNYLGSDQATYTLNFSKAGYPIVAQFYQVRSAPAVSTQLQSH